MPLSFLGFARAGKDPITNLQDHLANPWVNNFATVRLFPAAADLTHTAGVMYLAAAGVFHLRFHGGFLSFPVSLVPFPCVMCVCSHVSCFLRAERPQPSFPDCCDGAIQLMQVRCGSL